MGRTVAIIQARCASQRLPGKVMLDLAGHPLIWHVITRVSRLKALDDVVLATGDSRANAPLVDLAAREGWQCYVGPEDDVLARFFGCARQYHADTIVRITGDCPLASWTEIAAVLNFLDVYELSYASNCHPPMLPDGLDTEAFTFGALHLAHVKATKKSDREHVTPWLRANLPAASWASLKAPHDLSRWRLTVDEQADLDVMRELFRLGGITLDWRKAVRLLEQHPDLAAKNQSIMRNEGYLLSVKGEA